MITYNNIVNRFERFVADHLFLKTFTHGSPSGVDLEKFEVYPALHLVYTGATYDNTSKEYSFEVYILDLPPDKAKKIENQTQLVSNAEQVAEDILADMMNGDHVFNFSDLYTVTSASTTPLEETTSNSLAGILLTISIEVGYAFDSCNAPLFGVTPSGSEFPEAGASGLRIVEVDGSPDVSNVTKIIVSNGTLIDNGSGVVSLDTKGGGSETLKGLTDVDVSSVVENNTLVYDTKNGGEWVNGYPNSKGQESVFILNSTKWSNYTGSTHQWNFGAINTSELTIASFMKAGWVAGIDSLTQAISIGASTPTAGSTVTIEVKYSLTLDTATAVYMTASLSGFFDVVSFSFPSHTSDATDVIVTSTTEKAYLFPSNNPWLQNNYLAFSVVANGTGTIRPIYAKITIVHG